MKTYTSSLKRSVRKVFMNSSGSVSSVCQSMTCLTHSSQASSIFAPRRRLYTQCAAIPYSASRCMRRVRTWISSGIPSGPMTVVCSARYRFSFGIAM